MNPKVQDLDVASKYITAITEEDLPPLSVTEKIQIEQQRNITYKINRILSVWEEQQRQDRKMKKGYAKAFMWILTVQLLIVNVVVVLISINLISLEKWVLNVFIVSVFGEVASIVLVIVKNLFKSTGIEMIELIKDLK